MLQNYIMLTETRKKKSKKKKSIIKNEAQKLDYLNVYHFTHIKKYNSTS